LSDTDVERTRLPLDPETVSVYLPFGADTDRVVDPEPITVLGLNEMVAPAAPVTLKPTVPLNPFKALMVIVYSAV
jgi:hypothetical protein